VCFAAADLYVLPTRYDPFANSTLEAVASGLPVVTTTSNGAHEILVQIDKRRSARNDVAPPPGLPPVSAIKTVAYDTVGAARDRQKLLERFDQVKQGSHPNRLGGVALAGTPRAVLEYMEEYVATGANYFVCSFQWGDISHENAMRSIELFASEVMPRYATVSAPA